MKQENLYWVHLNNNKGELIQTEDEKILRKLVEEHKIVSYSPVSIHSIESLNKSIAMEKELAWLLDQQQELQENEFVIFRSNFEENEPIQAGVHLGDDSILCLCCGGVVEPEDYEILGVIPWNTLFSEINIAKKKMHIYFSNNT